MIVPWQEIPPETLDNLIEEFVTRDGTDYGEQEIRTDTKVAQVREQLRGARDRLGMHDYLVGVYYYQRENYAGAMARFRELIEQDPGFNRLDGVYFYLATTLADTTQVSEAIPYFARLLDVFTESEFAEQAAARLTELEAGSLP